MEKKVRVKRLNHQDDVKRSWTATYPLIEDFECILPEEWERAQAELNTAENNYPQISSSDEEYNADNAAK
jgi:hypothetical protein